MIWKLSTCTCAEIGRNLLFQISWLSVDLRRKHCFSYACGPCKAASNNLQFKNASNEQYVVMEHQNQKGQDKSHLCLFRTWFPQESDNNLTHFLSRGAYPRVSILMQHLIPFLFPVLSQCLWPRVVPGTMACAVT